jgi:hypothetical protein
MGRVTHIIHIWASLRGRKNAAGASGGERECPWKLRPKAVASSGAT